MVRVKNHQDVEDKLQKFIEKGEGHLPRKKASFLEKKTTKMNVELDMELYFKVKETALKEGRSMAKQLQFIIKTALT